MTILTQLTHLWILLIPYQTMMSLLLSILQRRISPGTRGILTLVQAHLHIPGFSVLLEFPSAPFLLFLFLLAWLLLVLAGLLLPRSSLTPTCRTFCPI